MNEKEFAKKLKLFVEELEEHGDMQEDRQDAIESLLTIALAIAQKKL